MDCADNLGVNFFIITLIKSLKVIFYFLWRATPRLAPKLEIFSNSPHIHLEPINIRARKHSKIRQDFRKSEMESAVKAAPLDPEHLTGARQGKTVSNSAAKKKPKDLR